MDFKRQVLVTPKCKSILGHCIRILSVSDFPEGIPVLQTVAFGMGSGLLHKLNRDTMSFATKLNHIK